MNAFYAGINLGWIAGLFLAICVVGGILAALMCALPEKYHFRFNIGNTFIWSSLAAIVGLTGMLATLIVTVSKDDLEMGKHWGTECNLMEANVQAETFSYPVSKLNCSGVIINVPAKLYYRFIYEWQLYEARDK